jgi:hypothetical protein
MLKIKYPLLISGVKRKLKFSKIILSEARKGHTDVHLPQLSSYAKTSLQKLHFVCEYQGLYLQ